MHSTNGEVRQRTGTLALATPTVDRSRLDLRATQLLGQAVGAVASATEDDGWPCSGYRLGSQPHSGGLVDRPEEVSRGGDVGRLLANLVTDRVALVVTGQLGDITVKGGREKQGLAVAGRLVKKATNGRHEAHVGHSVGLVEDDSVDVGEAHCSLVDEIL